MKNFERWYAKEQARLVQPQVKYLRLSLDHKEAFYYFLKLCSEHRINVYPELKDMNT